MAGNYEFDLKSFSFKRTGIHIKNLLLAILKFAVLSLAFTVVMYFLISSVVSTDVDKKLHNENKMYEKLISELQTNTEMVTDAVTELQLRDDNIYDMVFHAEPPGMDPFSSDPIISDIDSLPYKKLIYYSKDKSDSLLSEAEKVEKSFMDIYYNLARLNFNIPPMCLPLKNVSFPQVGASVGDKVSPFLKTYAMHAGLDFVASLEDPVFASAKGTVVKVERTRKSHGNTIEIEHPGGYRSRYCHLSETDVRVGQTVRAGQKIGTVGMSGNSFAPHLHYEVLKNGTPVDPINYIFASVRPEDYANMLFMAVNTDKSMD